MLVSGCGGGESEQVSDETPRVDTDTSTNSGPESNVNTETEAGSETNTGSESNNGSETNADTETEQNPESNSNFTGAKPLNANASFSSQTPREFDRPVKLIFAIDQSGSMGNSIPDDSNPGERKVILNGSDPKNKRIKWALDYITELDQFDNFFFQLMTWNSDVRTGYQSNGRLALTNNASNFDRETYEGTINGSGTNYLNVLESIRLIVQNECPNQTEQNDNIAESVICKVVFLSDGLPTDSDLFLLSQQEVKDLLSEKVAEIREDASLKGVSSFTFDTVYLQPPQEIVFGGNQELEFVEDLLQSMASAGGGNFFAYDNFQETNFRFSINSTRTVEYGLKNIIAINYMARAGLDEVGKAATLVDSDGDGLPDNLEDKIETNPTSFDTDNDGLSDFYEYQQSSVEQADYDPLIMNLFAKNDCAVFSTVDFPDADNDYITDCEESLLGTDISRVDTDEDGFPDSIELRLSSLADQLINYPLINYPLINKPDIENTDPLTDLERVNNALLDPNLPAFSKNIGYAIGEIMIDPLALGTPNNNTVISNYQFEISKIDLVDTQRISDTNYRLFPEYTFLAGDNLICVWIVEAPIGTDSVDPVYSKACKIVNYFEDIDSINFRPDDFKPLF